VAWFRFAALSVLTVLLPASGMRLAGMDWPMATATVLSNFGLNDRGRPNPGVAFRGQEEVLAIADGEIVFVFSGSDGARQVSGFPSPLGTWTAVDHGNGLLGLYARHAGTELSGTSVREGQRLASSGISGWSVDEGAFFMLYDRRERRLVNPAMVFPPLQDTVSPQIQSVRLLAEDGREIALAQGTAVSQGRYQILVSASDSLSGGRGTGLAPQRIVVSVNGIETGRLSMETLTARDGTMLANRLSPEPADRIYAPFPAIEIGEVQLSRGQAIMEVLVQDIAGNSGVAMFRLLVE